MNEYDLNEVFQEANATISSVFANEMSIIKSRGLWHSRFSKENLCKVVVICTNCKHSAQTTVFARQDSCRKWHGRCAGELQLHTVKEDCPRAKRAALTFCQTRRIKWKTVLIIVVAEQVDAQGKRKSLQAAAWKTVSQEAFMWSNMDAATSGSWYRVANRLQPHRQAHELPAAENFPPLFSPFWKCFLKLQ